MTLCDLQLPGEFYGGCSGRLHARQQAPRPQGHHPASDLRRAHAHHVSSGQTAETDHASSTGGRGGARQPHHLPGTVQYAVPRVG